MPTAFPHLRPTRVAAFISLVALAASSADVLATAAQRSPASLHPETKQAPSRTTASSARTSNARVAPVSIQRDPLASPQHHLCILDRSAVDRQALVNVAANRRLSDLRSAIATELESSRQRIEAQVREIDDGLKEKPTDPTLMRQRGQEAEDLKQVEARASHYARQVEATRQAVTAQLTAATTPLVQAVARQRGCSVVLGREAIVEMGETSDLTSAVIGIMDRKLTLQPFGLVELAER